MKCKGGRVGGSFDNDVNKIDKGWVKVSRAFCSEREKHIGGEHMMLGIV